MIQSSKTTTDFQSQASTPDSSDPRSEPRGPRPAIRVSLACVQCRSKHMKCDATLPACKRCTTEGKTCFYAKSRRGIRDQKKRSLISDRRVVTPAIETVEPEAQAPSVPAANPIRGVEDGDPEGWDLSARITPSSGASRKHTPFDAYYQCFHIAHPFILPKRFLLDQAIADPCSMHFLLMAINYIGSLYMPETRSDELGDAAYAAACAPLPITPQSVQGLLIMSLAAFGNTTSKYYSGWLHRANIMVQELEMHYKAFAATASVPVVAESYRRTYWGLYWLNSAMRPPGNVDLPCEEWEYESGNIPHPVSLAQYDVALGRAEFSSLAYLVDLCRIIATYVLKYHNAPEDLEKTLFERADSLICDWLLKIPAWKLNLVNSEGSVDVALQQTIGLAHSARLKIRENVARDNLSLKESCSLGPSAGPSVGAQKVKCFGWHAINTEIQTANDILALFHKPLDLKNLSPLLVSAIRCMALVYLDACVFQGLDTPVYREKLTMLTRILAVHAQIWEVSRSFNEELRDVVAEYLSAPTDHPEPARDKLWLPVFSSAAEDAIGQSVETDFPDFNGFDTLDVWVSAKDQTVNAFESV
ncbi:hypothetical protein PG996_005756 [Apiospora saccharicola]|uniref:Zn(2)-C6 fungal-type domain-containing protein n=1 Tax=Apiospora saccharicola TaxID=335842 RepID=A0ABR1VRE9_9PEZI